MKRVPIKFTLWPLMLAGLLCGLMGGCVTTTNPDGVVEKPVISVALQLVLLEEANLAVEQYLGVVVPDPTPEQQLAMTLGRVLVRVVIVKLREAGMYEDVNRLEAEAGFAEVLEPIEPTPEE